MWATCCDFAKEDFAGDRQSGWCQTLGVSALHNCTCHLICLPGWTQKPVLSPRRRFLEPRQTDVACEARLNNIRMTDFHPISRYDLRNGRPIRCSCATTVAFILSRSSLEAAACFILRRCSSLVSKQKTCLVQQQIKIVQSCFASQATIDAASCEKVFFAMGAFGHHVVLPGFQLVCFFRKHVSADRDPCTVHAVGRRWSI